ncbi:hypothetical protein PUV54_03490 [Hyphococcus flavus]|uniref:Uncharacterized protein n=1 Tax=Hyphococcus flavus TaxID=1866326 RepID=A0AAE9ZCJ4_9PROT|nr:hypothetical protein [Hyphococcus flavus]WDI32254.1 hypothetical protein PUV54_03490 [Hyphococcus flavus]
MTRTKSVTLTLAAITALLMTGNAGAAVSYQYDGVYAGAATLSEGLSDPACRALPLSSIEIRNGALRAWDGSWQTVKGVVMQDGFFNADFYFPGRHGVVFEGRIDGGGRLTGGVFDNGCAWIVELMKIS